MNATRRPYEFETGIYRPPSEGGSHSLLVRLTRNCPWNRCTFCGMYKNEKFQVRPVEDVLRDIDAVAGLCRDLAALARKHAGGTGVRSAAREMVRRNPELGRHPGFFMAVGWLGGGGRTAFLQDANSLVMKTTPLVEILRHLRAAFPTLRRVTSYARSRTLETKPPSALQAIRRAGLDRLHVGLESGDDGVLKRIGKGVSAEGHIAAGRKALAAGFQLSAYWMPGLGGRRHREDHARNTARVLSAIDPHYIRSRPLHPMAGTPLHNALRRGKFEMPSPAEMLREIRWMVEDLEVTGRVCFDHAGNYWKTRRGEPVFSHSYEGYRFPAEKARLLARIDAGLRGGGWR